jgi:hypothetical protein
MRYMACFLLFRIHGRQEHTCSFFKAHSHAQADAWIHALSIECMHKKIKSDACIKTSILECMHKNICYIRFTYLLCPLLVCPCVQSSVLAWRVWMACSISALLFVLSSTISCAYIGPKNLVCSQLFSLIIALKPWKKRIACMHKIAAKHKCRHACLTNEGPLRKHVPNMRLPLTRQALAKNKKKKTVWRYTLHESLESVESHAHGYASGFDTSERTNQQSVVIVCCYGARD